MPQLASSTPAMLVDFSFMHLCSATLTLVLKSGVTGLADIRRAQFFKTPEECKSRSVLAGSAESSLFIVLADSAQKSREKEMFFFIPFFISSIYLKEVPQGKR